MAKAKKRSRKEKEPTGHAAAPLDDVAETGTEDKRENSTEIPVKKVQKTSSLLDSIFGCSAATLTDDSRDGNTTSLFCTPFALNDKINQRAEVIEQSLAAAQRVQLKNEKPTGISRATLLKQRRQQAQRCKEFTVIKSSLPDSGLTDDISSTVRAHGLAVVEDIFNVETLVALRSEAEQCRSRCCSALAEKNLDYMTDCNIHYYEVASRCPGRMDVRFMNGSDTTHFWLEHKVLNSVVNNLLYGGSNPDHAPKLVYAGWIFNFPTSSDQPWHQDGIPLFAEGAETLPAYALNVFIPLDNDDSRIESGPTEFIPLSHRMPSDAAILDMVRDEPGSIAGPLLTAGDCMMYDYRICHRGTANVSDRTRTILYLMYARPWFKEHMNFGSERLFT
jgi:ectoine hydroxylase-related dioxygenase (phytanoyl-CoA dioxygenase family)